MHRLPCILNGLQAYIVGPHGSVGCSHLRTVSGVHNLGDTVPYLSPSTGAGGESHLQGEKRGRLMKLAAQVAAEQDPKKFSALLGELNALLQEKEQRLQTQGKAVEKPTPK